jgi:hypothetical protein
MLEEPRKPERIAKLLSHKADRITTQVDIVHPDFIRIMQVRVSNELILALLCMNYAR